MLDAFRRENIFDNDHSSDGNYYDKDDAGNDEEKGVIMTMLHSAQSLCWSRLGVKTYPLRPAVLFSRAWVKVMSLIKEIDEILTCSNIDHGGYNGYDDDLKKLSRFDDDVCDELNGVFYVKGQGKIKAYGTVKRLISLLFILA